MWVWLGNWCLHRHPAGYHTQWLLYITHTCTFNGPFPGLSGWAGTRKVKPIWILLKQETVNGSGISWTICKSAPRSRQITTPALHHSVFYRPGCPFCLPTTGSKHWRHWLLYISSVKIVYFNKKLCYHRQTWQHTVSVEIFSAAA